MQVVGMSGGVDSVVVTAFAPKGARLCDDWHLHEKTGTTQTNLVSAQPEDYKYSQLSQIGTPYYSVNFGAAYRGSRFEYFLAYDGRTQIQMS